MTLSISFEVFPPKSTDGLDGLRTTVSRLSDVEPAFVSVTYGAGGSDRERSFAAIEAVRSAGFDVAAHLTCVGQPRTDIDVVIDRYAALGVGQIVALRGDPPAGIDVDDHLATSPPGDRPASMHRMNHTPTATSAPPTSSARSSSEATSASPSRPTRSVTRSPPPMITT